MLINVVSYGFVNQFIITKNQYMKKLFQLLMVMLLSIFITSTTNAQGLYFHVNTGYNFNMSSQTIYMEFIDISNGSSGNNYYTVEDIFVSLGKGLNFGGTIGFMFSEYVGMELGLSYLMGMKTAAERTWHGGTETETETISSKMLRIIPAIVITPGLEGVNPYAKFGIVIGNGSINYEYEATYDGNITFAKVKFNGGMALGLNSAVGVQFVFSDILGMFAEINMVNMSYAPTKGEITEFTDNGIDQLPNMTVSDKEFEFVNEITHSYEADPPEESQPTEMLKYKYPFGSVGVHVGLVISLGN